MLDQTNYRKSVDQVLALLQVLNCDMDLVAAQINIAKSSDANPGGVLAPRKPLPFDIPSDSPEAQ